MPLFINQTLAASMKYWMTKRRGDVWSKPLSEKLCSSLLAQTYLVGWCRILWFLCLKITFLKAKGKRNCSNFARTQAEGEKLGGSGI